MGFFVLLVIVLLLLFSSVHSSLTDDFLNVDPNGYMVYCPCMGRFGNQAEHFLGALAFAKEINRTLILPPWVEFDYSRPNSSQIPFDTYFSIEPLRNFHSVVTMETFMDKIAPALWPPNKRYSFCWSKRMGPKANDCNAKDGNPFGPFWDHFLIDFVGSQFYGSLNEPEEWTAKFPPEHFPVLAFVGAPAKFPMMEEHRYLQKYLQWSPKIAEEVQHFIKTVLPEGPFLGVHLRNDLDWPNVCKHVGSTKQLFSSAQCLGYSNEKGTLTPEICQPDEKSVVDKVERLVRTLNLKSIFVASDRNHMIDEFNAALRSLGVKAYKLSTDRPQVDLAILGKSTYFVGNCVSSFTAFVKRERDVKNLPSSFWGIIVKKQEDDDDFETTKTIRNNEREDL